MDLCVKHHGIEPAGVLCVRGGADPSGLVPHVSEFSQCATCLLLTKRGYRVPQAGIKEWPPNGSCKEHPKVKMPTNALDLHLGDLILKAESDLSSGSLTDIHNGGRSIPTAGVFGARCPVQVHVLCGWRGPRVVRASESRSGRALHDGLDAHSPKALGVSESCWLALIARWPHDAGNSRRTRPRPESC